MITRKLILGDCTEILKGMQNNSAVICVTSPPYNLNKKASGGGSSKRDYKGWYPDDMPEEEYQHWQQNIIEELMRITSSSIFYNHRVRYAWHSRNKYRVPSKIFHPLQWLSGFPLWCEIIWARGGTTGHANGRFRLADERIYQIKKPEKFHDLGFTTVWNIHPSKNEHHVCTFPEELVRRCILSCTDEGDTVIDPFMGVGTVGMVCKELGRGFIGIEKEERYFNIAKDRIDS